MKETRPPFDPGPLKVGVLALQGSFQEHLAVLTGIGVQTVELRLPEQIHDLDGIIIPGGESTTIGKLAVDFDLLEPLRNYGKKKAIWGTPHLLFFHTIHKNHSRFVVEPLLSLIE